MNKGTLDLLKVHRPIVEKGNASHSSAGEDDTLQVMGTVMAQASTSGYDGAPQASTGGNGQRRRLELS